MKNKISVRLPDDINRMLADYARHNHVNRCEVVRMAVRRFLIATRTSEARAPFEKVNHLIGSLQSGIFDLGSRHREHMIVKLRRPV